MVNFRIMCMLLILKIMRLLTKGMYELLFFIFLLFAISFLFIYQNYRIIAFENSMYLSLFVSRMKQENIECKDTDIKKSEMHTMNKSLIINNVQYYISPKKIVLYKDQLGQFSFICNDMVQYPIQGVYKITTDKQAINVEEFRNATTYEEKKKAYAVKRDVCLNAKVITFHFK